MTREICDRPFNLVEGYSLSDAVDAINRAELNMGVPAGITGKFADTAQAFYGRFVAGGLFRFPFLLYLLSGSAAALLSKS
jgi:hypothetical protein